MTEMFGEAWSPMSVPDLAPDDDDDFYNYVFRIYSVFAWSSYHMETFTSKTEVGF